MSLPFSRKLFQKEQPSNGKLVSSWPRKYRLKGLVGFPAAGATLQGSSQDIYRKLLGFLLQLWLSGDFIMYNQTTQGVEGRIGP